MNRSIKFRGRRKDNGEWVYGYLIGTNIIVGDIVELTDEYFNTEYWCMVDPETVGQVTGCYDKMGHEIYEGDILKFRDTSSVKYGYEEGYSFTNHAVVMFEDGGISLDKFHIKNSEVYHISNDHRQVWSVLMRCKVVGNIYDYSNTCLMSGAHTYE